MFNSYLQKTAWSAAVLAVVWCAVQVQTPLAVKFVSYVDYITNSDCKREDALKYAYEIKDAVWEFVSMKPAYRVNVEASSRVELQRIPSIDNGNPAAIRPSIDITQLQDPPLDEGDSGKASEKPTTEVLVYPVRGVVTDGFGNRFHPIFRRLELHRGMDIAASMGASVVAALDGTVTDAGARGNMGRAVIVENDKGDRTVYGHLSSISVEKGMKVKAGDSIGRVGSTGLSTGPHLHFEFWMNGRVTDPRPYLTGR